MKTATSHFRRQISPARAAAFDILLRIERESSYASELLHSKTYDSLAVVDHSLTTELVMGVLRWRSLLDYEISHSSAQPLRKLDIEVLTALRLALYQLRWLTRIPARAAINESVDLVKRARKHSAAPFVNAVLRKLAAISRVHEPDSSIPDPISAEILARDSSHPEWLVERWMQAYGFDVARKICQYNQSIPVTAIRLRQPDAAIQLEAEEIELTPGAFLISARRIKSGDISRSASFCAGRSVIQNEASQLVAALVGTGVQVLDCCAAPGGKTLAIGDLNPNAQITAVELHPHRAQLLRKLLRSFDASGISVIAADARSLPFTRTFDRVLADVPCSGTGTLARNPEIKWRLTPADLADLQQRQVAILRSAMDRVAAGGRLIYSTCSLEREENEEVVERCLAYDPSFHLVDCNIELKKIREASRLVWPDISSLTHGRYLRTLPGIHPSEGFFAAILQKN